jgi:hypothetical protein
MGICEPELRAKFAAIARREAPREFCLLHQVPLLLYVYKSISRNTLDIIWGQELLGHFNIIGNVKQTGLNGFRQ